MTTIISNTSYNDLLIQFLDLYEDDAIQLTSASIKGSFKRVTGYSINDQVTEENLAEVTAALKSRKMPLVTFGEWLVENVSFDTQFEYGITGITIDKQAAEAINSIAGETEAEIVLEVKTSPGFEAQKAEQQLKTELKHSKMALETMRSEMKAQEEKVAMLEKQVVTIETPADTEEAHEVTIKDLFIKAYAQGFSWAYVPPMRTFCNDALVSESTAITDPAVGTYEPLLPIRARLLYRKLTGKS